MPFQFRKEAIEEDLNTNFPSQGQGNPPLYYSLSEVVVPTYSINNVAEGTSLPENLQTAWDFSNGSALVNNATTTVINNTGFWQIDFTATGDLLTSPNRTWRIELTDGITPKRLWGLTTATGSGTEYFTTIEGKFVVFVNTGQSVQVVSPAADINIDIWYRQIADINGNLVNPLGFSFA